MKRNLHTVPALALLAGLTGWAAWAESPLPAPFPMARYQEMSERSPFAVATAATATAAPTPGFASQLYVDGIAHALNTDFVAIKSRDPDNLNVVFLEVGKSNKDGLKVERVSWSPQLGKSTVEVSKNGEKATLLFDEQTIKNVAVNQPVLRPLGRPMNFPPQVGPQYTRFFQQPGQTIQVPGNNPALMPNGIIRRQRGLIQSGP